MSLTQITIEERDALYLLLSKLSAKVLKEQYGMTQEQTLTLASLYISWESDMTEEQDNEEKQQGDE